MYLQIERHTQLKKLIIKKVIIYRNDTLNLEYESISDESYNISHKFQSFILLF